MNISGDPPKFFGGPPFGGPPQKYGGPLLFWGPRGPSKNYKTKRKPSGAPKKITCASIPPPPFQINTEIKAFCPLL